MKTNAIQTSIFKKDMDLADFIASHTLDYAFKNKIQLEGTVIAITSKIVSIAENRLIPKNSISKFDLIKKEADIFLAKAAYDVCLTIKCGIVIPSAGIDESNSESGDYILFPINPYESAKKLWEALIQKLAVKNLGIIITDSHTHPLRRGVTGIALSHWGFKATKNLIGEKDLFGRELRYTAVNAVDALAVTAVYTMGEVNECKPIAIIESPAVDFCESIDPKEIQIEPETDLYYPLLKNYI